MNRKFPFLENQVSETLQELYEEAAFDRWKFFKSLPAFFKCLIKTKNLNLAFQNELLKNAYIPVSEAKAFFLYHTIKASKAKVILEFGASFGLSTIVLGAAAKNNPGALVISSEFEKHKWIVAKENVSKAKLDDVVEILFGDALETLPNLNHKIDFLLLDGWKDGYLPLLKKLEPSLSPGAIICADNIFTFKKGLAPYVEYVQKESGKYQSYTLPLDDGFEVSHFVS